MTKNLKKARGVPSMVVKKGCKKQKRPWGPGKNAQKINELRSGYENCQHRTEIKPSAQRRLTVFSVLLCASLDFFYSMFRY